MPATVIVNNMTVVHKASDGIVMIFPDTCKTPTPAGPVPIPYPNIAMSSDTAKGTTTVKCDGQPIMIKSSNFSTSTGDEPGSANGVVSNCIKGKALPQMYSFDVKADGENVFRFLDIMLQNAGSATANTPPGTELQPPAMAMGLALKPDDYKVTKLKWDQTECCCGDEVKLTVETKNFTDGWIAPITIQRKAESFIIIGNTSASISGNKSNPAWISRRGPYIKDVKLEAKASGFGGPAKSSNELEVKGVEAAPEIIGAQTGTNRLTPKYVQDATGAWVPTGTNYGWNMCYEIQIKDGELIVTKKVDFSNISASGKQKKRWKKEIEAIWDKKYKLHRKDCKRGDNCDCIGGCCIFPIRIICEWGGGHGLKVKLNRGANSPTDWGGPNWWYSHNWWEGRAGVPRTVRPHEFGHLIGMYDEYPAGACDPGRVYTNEPSSIMNSGSTVYERHMVDFHDWFDTKAKGIIGETKLLKT